MKIKAFITDTKQISRLLASLNIQPFSKPEPIKATAPPQEFEHSFDDLQFVA
jgi:hypothetical protein